MADADLLSPFPIFYNGNVHECYVKQKGEFHFHQKSDNEFLMFLLDTAVRVISVVQHLAPVIEAVSDGGNLVSGINDTKIFNTMDIDTIPPVSSPQPYIEPLPSEVQLMLPEEVTTMSDSNILPSVSPLHTSKLHLVELHPVHVAPSPQSYDVHVTMTKSDKSIVQDLIPDVFPVQTEAESSAPHIPTSAHLPLSQEEFKSSPPPTPVMSLAQPSENVSTTLSRDTQPVTPAYAEVVKPELVFDIKEEATELEPGVPDTPQSAVDQTAGMNFALESALASVLVTTPGFVSMPSGSNSSAMPELTMENSVSEETKLNNASTKRKAPHKRVTPRKRKRVREKCVRGEHVRGRRPGEIFMKTVKSSACIPGVNYNAKAMPPNVSKNIGRSKAVMVQCFGKDAADCVSILSIRCPLCGKFIKHSNDGAYSNFKEHMSKKLKTLSEPKMVEKVKEVLTAMDQSKFRTYYNKNKNAVTND